MPSLTQHLFRLFVVSFCLTISSMASASEPMQMKLGFNFEETSASMTAGVCDGQKLIAQILAFSDATPNQALRGPGNSQNHSLNLFSALGQATNGVLVAVTNSTLGFGDVRAFTAALWFRQNSHMPGVLGPRLFILGAEEAVDDTGRTNTIGLKFQSASCLHFQLNEVIAETDFAWSLPTNQWLFAAMVYDGSHIFVYIGSEKTPATLVIAKAAFGRVVSFGESGALLLGNRADRSRCFDGQIDDFRFYAEAGDSLEVESIRKSALGPAPTEPGVISAKDKQDGPGIWVVVSPPAFLPALAPLIEQRRADHYAVSVVVTTNVLSKEQILSNEVAPLLSHLGSLFGPAKKPAHLLLAGLPAGKGIEWLQAVPCATGSVERMQGKPSDFPFALPDVQGRPGIAVGRFPARNPDELRAMVTKTLNLERSPAPGAWRSRMVLLQGNPGGGFLAEAFVDGIARPRIGRLHPAWQLQAISHNGPSRFYVPTSFLSQTARDYLTPGQLFSVYLGHSGREGLWSVNTNFMSAETWARIQLPGHGVFFTCGCFGCEADSDTGQSYGLAAMRNPNGPAAVMGPVGASSAAPGLLAADGLLRACSEPPFPSTLAEYWLAVQSGLAQGYIDKTTFSLLDNYDGTGGKTPLAAQRLEHLEMWTLLGDPALRLPMTPLNVILKAPGSVHAGQVLLLEGELPPTLAGAEIAITLERPVGSIHPDMKTVPARSADNQTERERIMTENCHLVNETDLARATATVSGARFKSVLNVPANLNTPIVLVRVYAQSTTHSGHAILKLPVMNGQAQAGSR